MADYRPKNNPGCRRSGSDKEFEILSQQINIEKLKKLQNTNLHGACF